MQVGELRAVGRGHPMEGIGMDTTAPRSVYDRLLEVATEPDLGDASDGGWDADLRR